MTSPAIMSSKKYQIDDDRFRKVTRDPRFWEMPEKERKIKIDKRFQSMFHDKRFKVKYTVDKRGRPINHTSTEDLKRFYNLSDSDEDDDEDGKVKKKVEGEGKKKKKKKEKNKDNLGPVKVADKVVVSPEKPQVKGKAVQKRDTTLKGQQLERGVRVVEKDEEEEDDDDEEEEEPGDNITDGVTVCSEDEEDYDEDDDDEEEEEEEEDEGAETGSDVGSSSEDESGSESEGDSDSSADQARGVGNVETSSDEDEDEDEDIDTILKREEEEIEHDWGDLCKDAPRSDEVSSRLAVCNMDWDRMKAKDLMAVLNSFKPKEGVVLSVKIYPSEFGKERMRAEHTQGPMELMDLPEDPERDTEEEKLFREKMRDYQFKRMKYYYAVAECDSKETAAKIYEECDGFEYESSCSMLDLRFIPDGVTFEDEPKDVAVDVDLSAYTPKLFTSTAAATSKVEVTWDETDHERVTAMNRNFNKDELLDMDFKAYLASSSEEENDEEEFEFGEQTEEKDGETAKAVQAEPVAVGEVKTPKEKKMKKNSAEQISKYRELIKSIQDKDKKQQQDKEMEMEITWVPGLKETTEQLVKKKLEGKDSLTPWEEFLEKKKDKKKHKKKQKQDAAQVDLSDDEIPPDVDLNDPFFSEELGPTAKLKKNTKGKKNKKAEEERTPEEEEELAKRKAEMALLMDDEGDKERKHFNYDKIVEQQNLSKKKRKKLLKTEQDLEEDDFQVDVKDPRFEAMFTSHLYNLDPTDPNYKKTKATQSILDEKQRRRKQKEDVGDKLQATPTQDMQSRKQEVGGKKQERPASSKTEADTSTKKAMDPSLSTLIKSIKNKTEQFQARKKQKTV